MSPVEGEIFQEQGSALFNIYKAISSPVAGEIIKKRAPPGLTFLKSITNQELKHGTTLIKFGNQLSPRSGAKYQEQGSSLLTYCITIKSPIAGRNIKSRAAPGNILHDI